MRKFKFRGKTSHCNNEWRYGDLVHTGNRVHILELCDITEDGHHVRQDSDRPTWVDEKTVCQYSGQNDMHGKEIYEGDIVRSDTYPFSDMESKSKDNYFGVVYYNEDESIWQVMQLKAKESPRVGISNWFSKEFYNIEFSDFEVIGNIFDNKGLFYDSDEEIIKWFLDKSDDSDDD